jgi:translation initiation factor IF-3
METRDAQALARKYGLDLVEVSPTARPPVCRITDYGKYKYELDKKKKIAKKNQVVVKLKEVKFRANTEEHDYNTKLRKARNFIESGNRVKCSLFFRGRENTHHELGFEQFRRIAKDLADIAMVESPARLNGKNLNMMLSPHKKT